MKKDSSVINERALTKERTKAIAVFFHDQKVADDLLKEYQEELIALADSCEMHVIDSYWIVLRKISSSTYISEGKIDTLKELLEKNPDVSLVILDNEITASQQRNLEKRLGVAVIDRTELILEIFSQRAYTSEAELQVELARSRYLLPRLKRMWGHLSRQKSGGSGGFVKGEGEKQIELDRRMVRERIHKLSRELQSVVKHRSVQRKAKEQSGIPTFALIGYTNAGKSTLLNQLTEADTYVEDKLFATLDPKTKKCTLPGGRCVLLTDTVGFIRKLPHALVAAFKSTLEAAVHENVLLHVVDASHPLAHEHIETTNAILKELKVKDPQVIVVFNKVDLCPHGVVPGKLRLLYPHTVCISAKSGDGISELLDRMYEFSQKECKDVVLKFSFKDYHLFTELKEEGLVKSSKYDEDVLVAQVTLPLKFQKKFSKYVVSDPISDNSDIK